MSQDFAEMLAQLKMDYLASLPEKIREVERAAAEGSKALREVFHKLKGSGKTYGVPEISQLAELVEKICVQQPDDAIGAGHLAKELLVKIHEARQSGDRPLVLESLKEFHQLQGLAEHVC